MQAAGIVEALDVAEQVPSGFGPGGVDPVMDPLGLEGVEEAFHGRVVPAVALAAHRGRDPRPGEGQPIGLGGVLDAAVGMMDQPWRGPLTLGGHVQRVECDLGMQGLAHRPADDLAGVQVEDRGQVQPAFAGRDVRSASQIWFGDWVVKLRPSLLGAIG